MNSKTKAMQRSRIAALEFAEFPKRACGSARQTRRCSATPQQCTSRRQRLSDSSRGSTEERAREEQESRSLTQCSPPQSDCFFVSVLSSLSTKDKTEKTLSKPLSKTSLSPKRRQRRDARGKDASKSVEEKNAQLRILFAGSQEQCQGLMENWTTRRRNREERKDTTCVHKTVGTDGVSRER